MTVEERRAYQKEYRANNKAKIAAHNKKYRAKNKESIAAYIKEYRQTPNGTKSNILGSWRTYGVIGNLSKIYDEIYLPSTHCDICKTEYKSTFDRCLDHCHLSGEFRQVLCRACNICDRWKKKVNQSEGED